MTSTGTIFGVAKKAAAAYLNALAKAAGASSGDTLTFSDPGFGFTTPPGGVTSPDRIETVSKSGDADHTSIADAVTAVNAYGTSPSEASPAAIRVLDSEVYDEDVTLPGWCHLDAPFATVDGTLVPGTGCRVNVSVLVNTADAPVITHSVVAAESFVKCRILRPKATGSSANAVLLSGAAATLHLSVGLLDMGADEAVRITSSGRLYADIDAVEGQSILTSYELLEAGGASCEAYLSIGSVGGTAIASTTGLLQLSSTSSSFVDIGSLKFDGSSTSKIYAASTSASMRLNIGQVIGWDTANTNTSSGTVEVNIGNLTEIGWAHPTLAAQAANLVNYWPLDDSGSTQTDDQGSLDISLSGTYDTRVPGPNADGSRGSTGRYGVAIDSASGSRGGTSALGATVDDDWTLHGWVRTADTTSGRVLLGFSDSAQANSALSMFASFDGKDWDWNWQLTTQVSAKFAWSYGGWIPFAITTDFSATTTRLYLGGVLAAENTSATATDFSAAQLYLGGANTSSPGAIAGYDSTFSELRLYSAYISDAEFYALAARTF